MRFSCPARLLPGLLVLLILLGPPALCRGQAVMFGDVMTISGTFDVKGIAVMDVDADNLFDVVAAAKDEGQIVWYRNLGINNGFGPATVLTTYNDDVVTIEPADVDNDGDLDLLYSLYQPGAILLYINADGAGDFTGPYIVDDDCLYVRMIKTGDIDGDGDLDILAAPYWYENINGAQGQFGDAQWITGANGGSDFDIADVDQDGDNDVLIASTSNDEMQWFKNVDGLGTFDTGGTIAINLSGYLYFDVADIDGDGDPDIVLTDNSTLSYRENLYGTGVMWGNEVIYDQGGTSLICVDVDGDLDLDPVLTCNDQVLWFENLDQTGQFSDVHVAADDDTDFDLVQAADLDNDHDLDLITVSTEFDQVMWFENLDHFGTFGERQFVSILTSGATSVNYTDLDGDSDNDILVASAWNDAIAWLENRDGLGDFSDPVLISGDVHIPTCVFSADMDGDGDQDVLSASRGDDKIAWYENLDGAASFGPQQILTDQALSATEVRADDIDGDGDLDVLAAAGGLHGIGWFENLDGAGTFGPARVVTLDLPKATCVFAADLDGDTDLDVLGTSRADDKVVWLENLDGLGNFGNQQELPHDIPKASAVCSTDLDGDGDMDVIATGTGYCRVFVFVNEDGAGTFSTHQAGYRNRDANAIAAADLDGDGDQDFLITYSWGVAWYENRDPENVFLFSRHLATLYKASSVQAGDLDGDTDPDVLVGNVQGNAVTWVENLGAPPVSLTATGTSTTIPASGGTLTYDVHFTYDFNQPATGLDYWAVVYRQEPSSHGSRRVFQQSFNATPGMDVEASITHEIPASFENGSFLYYTYVGYWGSSHYLLDVFPFTKGSGTGNGTFDPESWSTMGGFADMKTAYAVDPPASFYLGAVTPNPFNAMATVQIDVPEATHLRLAVYNVLGQHVTTLIDQQVEPGARSFSINGSDITAGVYFLRVETSTGYHDVRKLVLLK